MRLVAVVSAGKSSRSTKDTITRIQSRTDVYFTWLLGWQGILAMILMRNGHKRHLHGCKTSVCPFVGPCLMLEFMTSDYSIYDGADVPDCNTSVDNIQWTYNNGQFLAGSAFMYNYVHPNHDVN